MAEKGLPRKSPKLLKNIDQSLDLCNRGILHVESRYFTYDISIKNIDLVFFPIVEVEHCYLFCFNLKRAAFLVIDNLCVDVPSENKYGATPSLLIEEIRKQIEEITKQIEEGRKEAIKIGDATRGRGE